VSLPQEHVAVLDEAQVMTQVDKALRLHLQLQRNGFRFCQLRGTASSDPLGIVTAMKLTWRVPVAELH
jgi:L-lactate utilization protein LutC